VDKIHHTESCSCNKNKINKSLNRLETLKVCNSEHYLAVNSTKRKQKENNRISTSTKYCYDICCTLLVFALYKQLYNKLQKWFGYPSINKDFYLENTGGEVPFHDKYEYECQWTKEIKLCKHLESQNVKKNNF